MKFKALGLYVLMIALILTACGSKTALTNDQYKTKMEAAGYEVLDASDQFEAGVVETATIAMKDDKYMIEFYVLPTNDQAVSAFNGNKDDFEQMKGSTSSSSSASMGNSDYYGLTTGDSYYVVSRIDNTFLYVTAPKEYKDEIKEVIKELGY